ncbi:MAG: NUDIX hydrolase [Anaerolineales bacterium]|nr:NUDIX hydrolase [Anaerolineales bacterium]
MSIRNWKILETKYLQPRFRIDRCELSNGQMINAAVLEFQTWANVLAVTRDQKVVLVKQYRHGVQEVLLELPGGVVEDGETPMDGIKRELLEETGYATDQFIEVGNFYPNPANQTNTMYSFLALDVEKVANLHLDDGEDLEVHLIPLDELIAMTKRGEFLHALQVATLFRALLYMGRAL